MQIGLCEEYQVKIEHFILEFVESITITTEHRMRREKSHKKQILFDKKSTNKLFSTLNKKY